MNVHSGPALFAARRYSRPVSTDLSTNPRRDTRLRAAALDIDSSSERGLESLSLGVGSIAFVLVALVAMVVFQFEPAPISGPGIGRAVRGDRVGRRRDPRLPRRPLRDARRAAGSPARSCSTSSTSRRSPSPTAMIALLTWTLLAVILEQSFVGAEVFAAAPR